MQNITQKIANEIARLVLKNRHSEEMRMMDMNDHVELYLAQIDCGYRLKQGAYLGGSECQSFNVLAKSIFDNAIENKGYQNAIHS